MPEFTEEEQAAMDAVDPIGLTNAHDRDWTMGSVYGGDFRVKLILHLIDSGDLTLDEAENVMRWTEASDDPKAVIGLIAGEFGASKRAIASALEGTEFEVQQSEIEDATRDFDTYRKQVGGVLHTTAQVLSGYMFYQAQAVTSLGRQALGIEGSIAHGLGGEEGLRFKEGSYLSADAVARREERGTVADNVRKELQRLLDNGDLSPADYKRLKDKHAGKYGYENYTTLIDDLRAIYEEIGMDADRGALQQQSNIMRQLEKERGFTEAPEAELGALQVPGAREFGEEEVQDVDGNIAYVDGADDPYDFYSDAYGDGVFIGMDGLEGFQPLERAAYVGANGAVAEFVVDRSTGQAYSIDEWTLIKTDPQARARYEATKQTAPAVQEILNKPFFKDQYIDAQQKKMIGDWSDPSNVREWQRLDALRTGDQQIVMDPWVPSVSPTEPWETDTYDYKKGQASADWMSMTVRERAMRAKVMKDNGLVSDEQWERMGGEMYGTTGISVGMNVSPMSLTLMDIWEDAYAMSSTFQWDPLAALGIMGDQKALAAAPTRGYSGPSAPKYSVPASLREIPDYKALATESRAVFRGKMGRDMEDWELALLSDELGDSYKNQNVELIKLHRQAWEDAVSGGTMEVDFGEVEQPNKSLQFDIEEKYADELDRQERVEDRSLSRNLLMDSITTGRRMIG